MAHAGDKLKPALKALRKAQLEHLRPAAKRAADAPDDHEQLVDLIKVYTAIKAIDFAIKHDDEG